MLRVFLLSALLAAPLVAAADIPPLPRKPAVPAQPTTPDPAPPAPVATPTPPVTPPAPSPPSPAPQKDPSLYATPDDLGSPTDGTGYLLFKTLVVLGVVVSVIYLTLNVGARKLLKLGPQANALVKVIDRVPLDPKKSLYVLQVGGEFLLVGASEQGLNLISKLDGESVQKLLAERLAAQPSSNFLERLNALAKPAPRKPQ
ncbi:MAG: flagellar biosynthetic protein FliO [Deltaproteobacteria bacterium]|nr:flagellar biosynthetic protein FliO [Deltaproteobacteria bacterium]